MVFATFKGERDGAFGLHAPQRFSGDEWLAFSGICGHQHVPENIHWDPGLLPIGRLSALMGITQEEETFFMALSDAEQRDLLGTLKAISATTDRDVVGTLAAIRNTQDRIETLLRELVSVLTADE
jgi:hypothetical protein